MSKHQSRIKALELRIQAKHVSLRVFDLAGPIVYRSDDDQIDWNTTECVHRVYGYPLSVLGDCPISDAAKIVVTHSHTTLPHQ